MSEADYAVTVVVDPAYGHRLLAIPADMPVWIVDTPVNRAAAQQAWSQRCTDHLHGVTTFKFRETDSAEDTLVSQLNTIDLHHGIYSAHPPYTVIDVIGAALSDRVKTEMGEFGFDKFHPTTSGFRAVRPLPTDEPE